MAEQRGPAPYREPPEAGVGGEGPPFDLTDLGPSSDAEIERGVRDALVLDPNVDADNFVVEVENGEVRLSGRARSPDERRRALEAAGLVRGVRRVIDRLAE
jgi:osmotically-inducible protein OsmY